MRLTKSRRVRALLADGKHRNQVGTAWANDQKRHQLKEGNALGKKRIVDNVFRQLRWMKFDGDVFFFDDRADYLQFVREHVQVPDHTNFYTVHYDCISYAAEGKDTELVKVDVKGNALQL